MDENKKWTDCIDQIDSWRKCGEHLPWFLRDFHDQKSFFKALSIVVHHYNSKLTDYMRIDETFVNLQLFTIDVFLWTCARMGYTLQRTRKRNLAFQSVDGFICQHIQSWLGESPLMEGKEYCENVFTHEDGTKLRCNRRKGHENGCEVMY